MNVGELNRTTGGQLTNVAVANVPGMREAFNGLLSRVQALPFVPSDWLAQVNAAMDQNGGLWQPRYAINAAAWRDGKDSPLLGDVPTWLQNNPEAARAWNTLADWWGERMQPILAGWARNEADVMNAANADAMFWNVLYASVKPAAVVGQGLLDAPEKVGEVASGVVLGTLRGFAPILLIAALVGLGFLAYKSGAYKRLMK